MFFSLRQEKVPIDMASEQKNLMGIVSTRQAIYLGVGVTSIYAYITPLFKFLNMLFGWLPALIVCAISTLPIIAIVLFLGFYPVGKLNMNRDYYMLIKIQRKTQYGLWRKGN